MDSVDRWVAARALKGAVDAELVEMLRSLRTRRPEEAASIAAERLEQLLLASGLPLGVAMKEAFGAKNTSELVQALAAGFPPSVIAKIRADLGQRLGRASPSAMDPGTAFGANSNGEFVEALAAGFPPSVVAEIRAHLGQRPECASPSAIDPATALAPTLVIPLPERFEDPAAALALTPAIALPEHVGGAGEPPAAATAAAGAPEEPAHAEQTEEAAGAAEAHARASEAPPGGDEQAEATMRTVARAAAAMGITPTADDLRIAARIMERVVARAERFGVRAPRLRAPIRRRPRASRAPRRNAHRRAVAPARDGPPADDAPPPVASHSPRSAIGGAR